MNLQIEEHPDAILPAPTPPRRRRAHGGKGNKLTRQLTVEYRTLSIQLSRQVQTHRPDQADYISRQHLSKLEAWVRRHLPLFSNQDTSNVNRAASLVSTADSLGTLTLHLDSVNDTLVKFGTSPVLGLENKALARRRERDGPNSLSAPPNRLLSRAASWLFGGFCSLLWIADIVVWISWKPLGNPAPNPQYLALAIVILLVILLQASFNAYQEWSTSRVMASITNMLPTETVVTRDGAKQTVVATDLVQGDIVHVRGGDKVPADLRIIESSRDLKFDRSMLTGESDAVVGAVNYTDENYLETRNIAVMGSHVIQGSAVAVVVATGDNTVMGRIAKLTSGKKPESTLLQIEITRFVLLVAIASLTIGTTLIVLWAAWLRHSFPTFLSLPDALVNSIGVIIAACPEGFPVCLALSLTIMSKRMQRQNVLVKRLSTVETLGSVNVICSDKTGTLTQNRMSVVHAGFISNVQTTDQLKAAFKGGDKAVRWLYETATLCNGATFDAATLGLPINEWKVNGDATDASILHLAEYISPVDETQNKHKKLYEIPFNSKNKWMLTLQQPSSSPSSSSPVLFVKGAPDVLVSRCSSIQDAFGNILPLNKENMDKLQNLQQKWTSEGQRVLMLCRREFSDTENPFEGHDGSDSAGLEKLVAKHNKDLCIVGLVGIVDPPRDEIPQVVDTCRRAGIRVMVVTGDFALTAAAIAKQCHIITNDRVDAIEDVFARANGCLWKDNTDSSKDQPLGAYSAKAASIAGSSVTTTINTTAAEGVTSLVVSGSDLVSLQSKHWDIISRYSEIVFARTTPDQKLLIVEELRRRECYVAVTGDGVNDSPALRAAHIGIAMGAGSEVAKEAADMILLDDNFASIVVAIENGRLVFENLKKVLLYLLPAGSFSEFVPMFLNMVLGVPLPLSVIFMIVICMVTDVWASLSLIYEQPESDILLRPPRNPKKEHLADLKFFGQAYGFIGILECLFAHIMFFVFMYWHGGFTPGSLFLAFDRWTKGGFQGKDQETLAHLLSTGQSIYFLTLVILQWGNMFATRTRRLNVFRQNPLWGPTRNLRLLFAIPFTLGVVFFFCYIGWFNNIFGTANIPAPFFFIPIPFALLIVALDEVRKLLVRIYPRGFFARIAW